MPAERAMTRRIRIAPWTLYACSQLPSHWVGTNKFSELYRWPRSGKWADREPYSGATAELTVIDTALARGTGWPGAGVGRRRVGGDVPGKNRTIRITDRDWKAIGDIADRQGQQTSEAVREAIQLAIARGGTR